MVGRLDPRMLYGIDLREYKGVPEAAKTGWAPPPPGSFNHLDFRSGTPPMGFKDDGCCREL